MSARGLFLATLAAVGLAACATSEKQWLKVDQPYTTAEFQRDYAACSKGGTLNDDCMRDKGWVDVKPSRGDRAAGTPPPQSEDWRQRRY